VPVVSEKGLLAFQKANNEYRRANDLHLQTSAHFSAHHSQYEKAKAVYERTREELAKTKKPKDMGPMAQNEMMDKLYNRLKDLYDARMQAKAELESAENDMLWAQARRRSALRDTIVPKPSVIPDILEKERENLKPSILERLRHMRHRSAGEEHARQFDQHIKDNYGFVNDPALSERIEHLTERVRALSPYPDESSHVRIIGRPRDPDKVSGLENGAWSTSDTIYFGIDYLEEGASDDEIMFVAGQRDPEGLVELPQVHSISLISSLSIVETARSLDAMQLVLFQQVPPANQSVLSPTQIPPKWPHFHSQTATTYIQPENPLSTNFAKIPTS
jgi:hypothetical protein